MKVLLKCNFYNCKNWNLQHFFCLLQLCCSDSLLVSDITVTQTSQITAGFIHGHCKHDTRRSDPADNLWPLWHHPSSNWGRCACCERSLKGSERTPHFTFIATPFSSDPHSQRFVGPHLWMHRHIAWQTLKGIKYINTDINNHEAPQSLTLDKELKFNVSCGVRWPQLCVHRLPSLTDIVKFETCQDRRERSLKLQESQEF